MMKNGEKSVKDLSHKLNEEKLENVEENLILKRWKSPSIMEVLSLTNAFRMIVFVCAIYYKFRVVNKRVQLYGNQIDLQNKSTGFNKIETILNLVFLGSSEIFSILLGLTILKYSNGRRTTINLYLILMIIPVEIAQFTTQIFNKSISTGLDNLSPNFYLNTI